MKRLLVFLFMAIFIAGISQSNEEMKFEKGKIIYNGEVIKLKKAKEIANEKSPAAFKYFKRAQLFNIGIIPFPISSCLAIGTAYNEVITQDYNNPKYKPYRIVALFCFPIACCARATANRSKRKGIQVFNESN